MELPYRTGNDHELSKSDSKFRGDSHQRDDSRRRDSDLNKKRNRSDPYRKNDYSPSDDSRRASIRQRDEEIEEKRKEGRWDNARRGKFRSRWDESPTVDVDDRSRESCKNCKRESRMRNRNDYESWKRDRRIHRSQPHDEGRKWKALRNHGEATPPTRRKESRDSASDSEDPRAARRRMLEKLRAEAEDDSPAEGDVRNTAAWQRMLKEQAERAAAKDEVESEAERMDISGEEEEDEHHETDTAMSGEGEVMMAMLGFTSFGTTKGEFKSDSIEGGVRKSTKRRYRQYMNRKGGFNRPLSPVF